MTAQPRNRKEGRLLPALIVGGGSFYLLQYSGPVLVGVAINSLSVFAVGGLLMSTMAILSDGFWYLGNVLDQKSALTATGLKGTSGWVESLDEIRHDLIPEGWGPYWGTYKGQEVMSEIGSNSLVVGTTGSGKGVGMVQNNILSIHGSKVVSDMKGENACITAAALRARGETVYCLNIGNVYPEILGKSAGYNPLVLIADNFWRPEGLLDVSDDISEIGTQLDPEPIEKDGNRYFKDGSRNLTGFAIQMCILINGYNATLGDVAQMLSDKKGLLHHAKWVCGRLKKSGSQEGE